MPEIITFENGAKHVRFSKADGFLDDSCFVQLPPGFDADTIPDAMIWEPDWNAKRVNIWWAEYRASGTSPMKARA